MQHVIKRVYFKLSSALAMEWLPDAGLWRFLPIPLVIYVILGRIQGSRKRRNPPRWTKVSPSSERVLVLGASSGVGRVIALMYARRGAAVCVVGRRAKMLSAVKEECLREYSNHAGSESERRAVISAEEEGLRRDGKWCLTVVADCSDSQDMVRVYEAVDSAWGRLDTVIITAGVSSVLPFMSIAKASGSDNESTSTEGLQRVHDVALRSLQGNFLSVLLTAAAFIPMLERTSPSPSIILLSSIASLIPAPTRALYAATKSAALLFLQSLAIEHPAIAFSSVLPASIEGDFRGSAVDAPVPSAATDNKEEEKQWQEGKKTKPEKKLLKRDAVAQACIDAVDYGKRTVWMPRWYRIAHALYWIWPAFIERGARKKYGYTI